MNKNTKIKSRRNRKSVRTGDKSVISQNTARNMQLKVSWNIGEDGKKFSVSQHIPIQEGRYTAFPNHKYIEYTKPSWQ